MSPQLFELIADIKLAGPDIEEVDAAEVGTAAAAAGVAVAGRCVDVVGAGVGVGLAAAWAAPPLGALPWDPSLALALESPGRIRAISSAANS